MSIYTTQLLRTPAIHRSSVTGLFDFVWNKIAESAANVTSLTFPNLAQSIVTKSLENLEHGQLRIVTPNKVLVYGDRGPSPELRVELCVRRPTFWTRVLLFKDIGFAEAYMYGDVDCDDISGFLRLFIANREQLKIDTLASTVLTAPQFLTAARFLGNLTNSRANISAHYDLSNKMFSAFLSKDMNYSTAIFKDFTEDLNPGVENPETLEEGQIRKMKNVIAQAHIGPGHRVLEIGSGWGELAMLAVKMTGCTVETLTLSSEQQELATQRIREAGLSDKITVHLMDYREVKSRPEWKHYFDRFVSVEMMEHVGKEFIETFWSVADWALKPNDAAGCVQVISMPEARVDEYDRGVDFIQKWVLFPGGYIPSCTSLIAGMTSGSGGRLTTDAVSNIGPHYARTLRHWKRNYLANFDSMIAPALRAEYKLSDDDLEIFKRKWISSTVKLDSAREVLGTTLYPLPARDMWGWGVHGTTLISFKGG